VQLENNIGLNSKNKTDSRDKLRRPESHAQLRPDSHAQLRKNESIQNLKPDMVKIDKEFKDLKVMPKIYLKNNNNNSNGKVRDLASNTSVQSITNNRE
jgi:hypothetical protein